MVVNGDGVTVVEEMSSDSRLRLKVVVTKERAMETYKSILKELSKKVKVPGFRPGAKMNPNLVAQTYGVQNLKAAVLEELMNKTMGEAMTGVSSRALDESDRIETDMEKLFESFTGSAGEPTADICYTIGVDVAPEVKWTSAYKDIIVEVQATNNKQTVKATAARELMSKVKDLGTLRVVADRAVQEGDVAVIDLAACRLNADGSDGEEVAGVNNKNFRFDTSEGDGFLPGLVAGVTGITTGETKTFELKFPDGWSNESLRGQTARFTATVKETFLRELPVADDALAPKLLPGIATMAEVKALILQAVEQRAKDQLEQDINMAITDKLADMVEIPLPDSMLQEQGRQNYSVRMLQLLNEGQITQEVLNTMMTEAMVANYIEHNRADVERMVRLTLAVEDIQQKERITVDEAELDKECASSRAEFERLGQQFDEERLVEQAKELLEGAKVLQWLKDNCSVTVKPLDEVDEVEEAKADGPVVFKF